MAKKSKPQVSFSFRTYTPADNPLIIRLVREHMQPVVENATGAPYNPDEFMYHVMSSQTRILESEGHPIGFFTYLPLPEEGRLLFSSMVLEKEFQGRGVGKKVFEFIEQEALRFHCPEVECEVQRGNDQALALYRDLGYQEVEVPWENTIRLRKRVNEMTAAQIPASEKPAAAKPVATASHTVKSKSKSNRKKAASVHAKKNRAAGLKTFAGKRTNS